VEQMLYNSVDITTDLDITTLHVQMKPTYLCSFMCVYNSIKVHS